MNKTMKMAPVLSDMIITDIAYLILGEIIIILFLPEKILCATGFLVGVVLSMVSSIHIKISLNKSLHAKTSKKAIINAVVSYAIRLFVIVGVFCLMYFTETANLLAALIGLLALKLSAYLGPVTRKIVDKMKR